MAVNENIAQAYARLILAGKRTLEQVYPQEMRHRVQEILIEADDAEAI